MHLVKRCMIAKKKNLLGGSTVHDLHESFKYKLTIIWIGECTCEVITVAVCIQVENTVRIQFVHQ